MRIRTRLQFVTTFSAALVVVMTLLVYWSHQRIVTATKVNDLANEIVISIFERTILRSDFLRYDNIRSQDQWLTKQIQVNNLIKKVSLIFDTAVDIKFINKMMEDNDDNTVVFKQIITNRENTRNGLLNKSKATDIENMLVGQLLLKTYNSIDESRTLQNVSRDLITSTQKTAAWISLSLIISLVLFVIIISWTLGRIINKGINSLQLGAAAIGGGDLHHTIPLTGEDEFTEVAVAFNTMSMKLIESHAALEKEIDERKRTADMIDHLNIELRYHLALQQETNRELESFTYSVSHDLRAPLRHVVGFVEKLLKAEQGNLGEKSTHYLDVIASSACKMGTLIDDLLSFSRMGRTDMMRSQINLGQLALDVVEEVDAGLQHGVSVKWNIMPLPEIFGDKSMLRLALVNLLSNAAKFSQKVSNPVIEVGCSETNTTETVYFVKDNGVGFDMQYADKLFGLFQRLHSTEEFDGTGVGLANVRRIINRHGGRTWAEGKLNEGATFYFALPNIYQEATDDH